VRGSYHDSDWADGSGDAAGGGGVSGAGGAGGPAGAPGGAGGHASGRLGVANAFHEPDGSSL
jgi:hypothetical protein